MPKRNILTDEFRLRLKTKAQGERYANHYNLEHYRVQKLSERLGWYLYTDGVGALTLFAAGLAPMNYRKGLYYGWAKYAYPKKEEEKEEKEEKQVKQQRRININRLLEVKNGRECKEKIRAVSG